MFLDRSVQDLVRLLKWSELEQQVVRTVGRGAIGLSVRREDVTEVGGA
ncbi:hypothetical protein A2U01_0093067, partial [Trifolium medium]|nr:hypothetical protein [Trifolium medium]